MGRPPSNGGPTFRFNSSEVAEMEALLQKHEGNVPPRDLLVALANGFSNSPDRAGKVVVQMKQVWSWFQNRRCALRAKLVKSPGTPSTSPVTAFTRDGVPPVRNVHHVPQQMAVSSDSQVGKNTSEGSQMDFEAKSARDSAWYDVQAFISHRYVETDNPEVLVRFAGFGPEEDEWVNILKHVRQRSLPCEASECIVVTPGDLILCFQEGKEQALYFDAHVLDAQRRRHDVRGCRCRFLVHFDHDQSEEIVQLRKICRRPETDYRLQQLHTANEALSTSLSKGLPKPVVDDPTPTNPDPSAATISVPLPLNVSVRPSVRPDVTQTPTAFTVVQALTTVPIRPSAPSPFLVKNSAPCPPPIGPPAPSALPIGLPAPSSALVVNPTPALTSVPASSPLPISPPFSASVPPILEPVPEQVKVQPDYPTLSPLLAPKPDKVETDCPPAPSPPPIGPPAVAVTPTPTLTSTSVPASPSLSVSCPVSASVTVGVPEIRESKEVDSDIPFQCAPAEPKKVESDNPAPVLVSLPESITVPVPDKVELQPDYPGLAPLLASEPDKLEIDGPSPLITDPDKVPESIKVESDDPTPVSIPESNKVESENPVLIPATARDATNNVDSINLGAQANVLIPTVENTFLKTKNVEDGYSVSDASTESSISTVPGLETLDNSNTYCDTMPTEDAEK